MPRTRHTEAEIIAVLKQVEAGRKAEDVAREAGVSKHTIYAWKARGNRCRHSWTSRFRDPEGRE
jgi:transposase